eukprot:CAMPEP_0170511764 /NCGR_PEP_ID=MMETSP0208-20121228/66479_1 /TAXON_ID=197538 /ORGANISM="Strombidium inclinatum, Strain S3" /LENGTH=131 /DNA_ID=CAMNT_0010795329 /DNA_START=1474 /DNA_END=1869 /DNA_ORIENTATION=-
MISILNVMHSNKVSLKQSCLSLMDGIYASHSEQSLRLPLLNLFDPDNFENLHQLHFLITKLDHKFFRRAQVMALLILAVFGGQALFIYANLMLESMTIEQFGFVYTLNTLETFTVVMANFLYGSYWGMKSN